MKDQFADEEFDALLRDLAASGVVRVCGSYANRTNDTGDHISDLDLFVLREQKGLQRVIDIFAKHGAKWTSSTIGHIGTPRNAHYMPFPIEASYHFEHERRVEPLTIRGTRFKAYTA